MSTIKKMKISSRKRRAKRVRKKVIGTPSRPRLCVYRSLNNMYVQIIDDVAGVSMLGISSTGTEMKAVKTEGGKVGVAKALGKIVAEKAKEKGIKDIVFDRNGFLYHGRIKAVAEGAREGGLNF